MEKLFREQIDTVKDKFIDICNYCYKNEHDYMFVNTTSKRIYNTDMYEYKSNKHVGLEAKLFGNVHRFKSIVGPCPWSSGGFHGRGNLGWTGSRILIIDFTCP